jgi:glycosyltransferase involved in cell wall biosynthesis
MPPDIGCFFLYYSKDAAKVSDVLRKGLSEKQHVKLVVTSTLGKIGRITVLPAVLRIVSGILKTNPSLVVSMFVWPSLATALAIRLLRIKKRQGFRFAIHLAGDLVPVAHQGTLVGGFYSLAARMSIMTADILYVISPKLEELIKSKYRILPRTRVVQLPIYVKVPGEAREWSAINDVKFGVVSRLTRQKGVHFVIQALAAVLKENLQASLVIYGDGPFGRELYQTVEMFGIRDHVKFMGWTDDPLRAFYGIDCLVLPSKGEGTPRSILEAASVGVPSIATDVGGIGDIVQDGVTGWLVPYGDCDALANAMRRVVREPRILVRAGGFAREKLVRERSVASEVEQFLKEGGVIKNDATS